MAPWHHRTGERLQNYQWPHQLVEEILQWITQTAYLQARWGRASDFHRERKGRITGQHLLYDSLPARWPREEEAHFDLPWPESRPSFLRRDELGRSSPLRAKRRAYIATSGWKIQVESEPDRNAQLVVRSVFAQKNLVLHLLPHLLLGHILRLPTPCLIQDAVRVKVKALKKCKIDFGRLMILKQHGKQSIN